MKVLKYPILLLASLFIAFGSTLHALQEEVMVTTDTMRKETYYTVQCLENIHYSNMPLKKLNTGQVIEEYLTQFDMHHLFFLQKEVDQFKARFAPSLDIYLHQGNLFPAFEMFKSFLSIANDRFEWIGTRLTQPFDFTEDEFYTFDRREAEWPSTLAVANQLWSERLKFELLNEILGQKGGMLNLGIWDIPQMCETNKEFPHEMWQPPYVYPEPYDATAPISKIILHCIVPSRPSTIPTQESLKRDLSEGSLHLVDWLKKASTYSMTFEQKMRLAVEAVSKRYTVIRKMFNDLEPSEVEEIFLSSVSRMYDPHTLFLSADSMEDFSIMIQNSMVGIGALLSEEEGYITVKELLPGGPVEKSRQIGINDKILGVGQENEPIQDIVGMKLRKAVRLIRGKEGTHVKLLIQPADGDPSARKEVVLKREEIKLTSNLAKAAIYEIPSAKDPSKKNKIGVIDLPAFYGESGLNEKDPQSNSTTRHVVELIGKLKQQNVDGIILDLRRNAGGLLPEVIALTGSFIPQGPILQVQDSHREISEHLDEDPSIAYDGPLAILVTRNSASGSEILAGALKNYQRALIIGDPATHGKGTVQVVLELGRTFYSGLSTSKMGADKITIQKWYLPDGNSIQVKGVESDIILPSANVYLPIGESDLPHALPWDSISSVTIPYFEGLWKISPDLVKNLNTASQERQKTLQEFDFLKKNVEWIKVKEEQQKISLKLDMRQNMLLDDITFRQSVQEERKQLPKENYKTQDILLEVAKEDPNLDKTVNTEDYDIFMQEGLRVMRDWLDKGPDTSSGTSANQSSNAQAPRPPASIAIGK